MAKGAGAKWLCSPKSMRSLWLRCNRARSSCLRGADVSRGILEERMGLSKNCGVPGWTCSGEYGELLTQELVSCFSHKTAAGPEGCWPVGITMKKFSAVEYLLLLSPATYHCLALVPSHPMVRTTGQLMCTQGQGEGRWERGGYQALQMRKGWQGWVHIPG